MVEKSTNTGSRYVFDTTDVEGKRVFLESKRFVEHIISHHPEMEGNEESIKDTIENPHVIIQSKQNPNRWLYVGKSEKATYPTMYIKTVVDHSNSDYGYVVTGLFQRKVNVEKEGKVVYEKD